MEIRHAHSADAPAVTGLLAQLGYPDNEVEDVRRRLERWERHPEGAAFVAMAGEGVVGVIAVVAIPLLEREGSVGRIVALVVDETQRGTGVGRELVATAEAEALRWGCGGMEVSSSRRRTGAHAFYRARGYEDRCERSAKFFRELTA
ncbi:GNAT family N-acetyltransferase [Amycolatopsis regifaucium]|uniref:Acetyltransferase n=1 Tax=Amycolatopsis regifaucium TaxID=546365 RepID=A0A154MI71_9PSEU|nr:GNAT family N-acetyltransferase [Amycolatopsis regifaucium]KZB84072.1 acetyltransferase [Amycolatopsis regifaucium]OKA08562.1 GNAT family N-acetyltransferase [Amycolatopsis regifaucium]